MPYWTNVYFTNANSPLMEHMMLFHDHSMIIIVMMISFLVMSMTLMCYNKNLNYNLTENQLTEVVWTTTPMILLSIIAIPSLQILYLMEENFNPSMTMKIIGHQWYWTYEYSDFGVQFDSFLLQTKSLNNFRLLDSDSYCLIPMNTSTRALVSSMDVIHSWTIPSLGIKTDAVPGRLNQLNIQPSRSGSYFGQCSEICGTNHSFMPISMMITPVKTFKKLMFMN